MRKFTLLFAVLLSLVGVTTKAETLTANFNSGLPDGWSIVGDLTRNSDRSRSGSGVWTSSTSDNANYLITESVEGSITFYARAYNKSKNAYVIIYAYDGSALGDQLYTTGNMYTSSTPSFSSKTANLGSYKGQVAIALNYAAIDDATYTPYEALEGPALAVKDGSTKLTSPASYNFGLATAGTTHTFTLSNTGSAAVEGLSVTDKFGATLSATSIDAGGEATLTITMPDATASESITISSTTDGIDDFVINVSGTVRDANKVYLDFSDGQIPDGWTSVAIGSYASSYGSEWAASEGYVSQSGSSSSYEWAFTSPKMTFAKDELIAFETAKYSSSTWYTPSIKVEYSLDGSSWTTIGSAFTDDTYGNWTSRSVTVPVEGVQYIRFSGWYIHMRNIYGGELSQEPKMVVTQPASLDFGVITEATPKTFTIANTGKATLEGISVTSSNSSIFSITGAPTSLAAGASKEVTITMAATTTGALNSDITVRATDMEDVEFTVTGVVLPESMNTEDFATGLPANWTNASWTFANGEATGKSSSAYLTTPKLIFSAGDMLVIKAKRYDSDTDDYLTVQGSSDNGATWTAYSKKLQNADGLTYPDYGTMVLTDIPTTVNKLRFVGYYCVVDEISGLTYAPVLSVTKAAEAVVSGSTYDFGESAADADVTYNFANTGAGTINITAVGITGEGAAAYSTNWAEPTTAPFDLVISRTYNAEREGASVAIVTVTTSEGEFVINVTGTDKSANAPELAVTPDEGAAFGVVTEAAEKTYTVTNAGTGTLTVNIASNDAKFTVSAAQLTDIAAGDSKTFKVIFTPVAETYGTFNANITVTPTYDEEAAVVIAASAKVKDPELWSEDFSGNAVPAGWNAGTNWSIADGVAKASYAYGSTTYLTTPALTVADASDELTFGYETTANYVTIKIQYSKDGGAFTDFAGYPSSLSNGATGTFTITGLEAGEYQFRFANDDYQLDNFEGFKLNLPDHIASITASTIPASSSWDVTMKEGQSFEATVTVAELRGVNEEVTAKLYMGETVIGQTTETVEASTSKVITITCTPTVAATDGVEMHIEVEWAGDKMTTEPTTRFVAAITYLTLDQTSSEAVTAGTFDHVTLKRTFIAGWNTVCLPFTVSDVEAFFGTGAKAYAFTSYTDAENAVTFETTATLTASYPYVVYVPEAITEDIALADITIESQNASPWYTQKADNIYFRGTYAPIAAGEWTKKEETDIIYGVTPEAKIMKAGESATIKGFRAYFDVPAAASVKSVVFNDLTTGVKVVRTMDAEMEGLFDLGGRKVNAARKGIFIQNGKKMVIR